MEKFEKNIKKRGLVPETTTKKGKDYPVGPIVLGFFVFVVIGSCNSFASLFLKLFLRSDYHFNSGTVAVAGLNIF